MSFAAAATLNKNPFFEITRYNFYLKSEFEKEFCADLISGHHEKHAIYVMMVRICAWRKLPENFELILEQLPFD